MDVDFEHDIVIGLTPLIALMYKLIGVQSNHVVEYFGGPAAPTLRFLHNQNQQFLHNQWFPHNQHNILMAATSLGRCCHQQEKRACSQHIVITRFASQEVSYSACRKDCLRNEHLVYTYTQCTGLSQNLPFTPPYQKKANAKHLVKMAS